MTSGEQESADEEIARDRHKEAKEEAWQMGHEKVLSVE